MNQITFKIDDQTLTVTKGTTIIRAAHDHGIEIPHYCYHPGLSIDGNCRMCLVEIEKSPKPAIACNTVATEGMVVKTKTANVERMRKSVMEFLLINHPLDCPTCDQAGECRLQDYYMSYDEIPSRFEEEKVHKDKMADIGAGVMLDQERCVACTRCIRFCKEVAKEDELVLANRGDHVTITTFPGKELSNPYAGNVVDVCPVGALTSKDFRYKKRVWFLKSTPSVCTGCSRGCNITVDHADNKIFRLKPRYNPEVNNYWMCDEGRYGFKFVNEGRFLRPKVLSNGEHEEVSASQAFDRLSGLIQKNSSTLGVVAHAKQTNESLEAILNFAKNVLKTSRCYSTQREVKNPFSDDYLITKDKNPNNAGLKKLGFKPLDNLVGVSGLLVFGGLAEHDLKKILEKKIPILGLWISNINEAYHIAEVIFPLATFAEQEGHFINVDGKVQKVEKALEVMGEAQTVVEWIEELSKNF